MSNGRSEINGNAAIAFWVLVTFALGGTIANPDPESTAMSRMIGAWLALVLESAVAFACFAAAMSND